MAELEFNDIEIADGEKIQNIIGKHHNYLGWEYTFPMTYLWNIFDETKVAYHNGMAFVFTKFFGECVYYPPYVKDRSLIPEAMEIIKRTSLKRGCKMTVKGLIKEEVDLLDKDIYDITTDRGETDYIYETTDLINLTGKKYHAKRNFINRFKSKYYYNFREFSLKDEKKIFTLYDKWDNESLHETFELEKKIMGKAIALQHDLDLKIGILEAEEQIIAVSIGYMENQNVAHLMFEKADTDYEGAYQMINQLAAENFYAAAKYINREEDMGMESIRKAKLSYRPAIMLDKYIVKLKK